MKVSIVILNWNGGASTCMEAIQSAELQNYKDKEIIFVDNGSDDDSGYHIRDNCPEVRYVQLPENIGCPPGRNKGVEYAQGELIFFMENDGVWASDDVVSSAVAIFERDDQLGAIYSKVEGYHTEQPDQPTDYQPESSVSDGLYLSSSFRGGASIIRTELFRSLGGFPNDFFRQGEERYLSLLIYDAKYKIAYWPERTLRHKGSDYPGKSKTVHRLNFEHEMKTIIRLYPRSYKFKVGGAKILFNFFRFISKGDIIGFSSVISHLIREILLNKKKEAVSKKSIDLVELLRRGQLSINLKEEPNSLDKIISEIKSPDHLLEPVKESLKNLANHQ